jgi:hypothetical protein
MLKSILSKAIPLGAAVIAFGMVSVDGAGAHDIATRCDWRGCSHIVCNDTGDRCHRFYGDDYGDGDRWYGSSYERWHHRRGWDGDCGCYRSRDDD